MTAKNQGRADTQTVMFAATTEMLEQGLRLDELNFSARGVDTKATSKSRSPRSAASHSVFAETMDGFHLNECMDEGESNDRHNFASMESIAAACSAVVHESVASAHRTGLLDECVVKSADKKKIENSEINSDDSSLPRRSGDGFLTTLRRKRAFMGKSRTTAIGAAAC